MTAERAAGMSEILLPKVTSLRGKKREPYSCIWSVSSYFVTSHTTRSTHPDRISPYTTLVGSGRSPKHNPQRLVQ